MDRVRLHDYLAQAERHIARGQKIIAQQRATIAQLKSRDCDTQLAEQLLEVFEVTRGSFAHLATNCTSDRAALRVAGLIDIKYDNRGQLRV